MAAYASCSANPERSDWSRRWSSSLTITPKLSARNTAAPLRSGCCASSPASSLLTRCRSCSNARAVGGNSSSRYITASLSDLRTGLNRLNESRGDLVKADDFNNRMTSVWNGIKDLQVEKANVTALKERSVLLEQQVKVADEERKELTRELQKLRERLAVQEAKLAVAPARPNSEH